MSKMRVAVLLLLPAVALLAPFETTSKAPFVNGAAVAAAPESDQKSAPAKPETAPETKKAEKPAEPAKEPAKPAKEPEKKAEAQKPKVEQRDTLKNEPLPPEVVDRFNNYRKSVTQSQEDLFGHANKPEPESQDSSVDATLSTGKLRLRGPSLLEK